jgi:predicted O-methyltransferase YrrM
MSLNQEEKNQLAASCRDTEQIPKVADAGKVLTNAQGKRIQVMHNGIQVLADGYYSTPLTQLIEKLQGHHEPQEEKVFYEILKLVKPGSTMIELGAYWGFYSLWFQSAVNGARNVMVEPEEENLRIGRQNFEFNGRTGTFLHALVSSQS